MKILLYFENEEIIKKSGIGRALAHQKKALSLNGVEFTTNPKDKYDIAHINTYYAKSLALLKSCKAKGIPVIAHGHSTKEDFRNSFRCWQILQFTVNKALKKVYSKPDLIITPTPYSKRLIENYSFVSCPVVAISNGIDIYSYNNITYTQEEIKAIRDEFELKEGQKIVIGIGWLFQRKGVQDFIEVAKRLPDLKFIWFGQNNLLINTHSINKAISEKSDNIIFPGYVPKDTIAKMLHIADCFFFPSYEETEGIVVLEALATKIPLLVRDIGVFDYCTDGVDCFKGKNNEEFIEKIKYIVSHDTTDIVENGYKLALDRDLRVIGMKLKEQYEKLLEAKKNKENN